MKNLRLLLLALFWCLASLGTVMGQDNAPDPSVDEFVLVKQEPKPLNMDSLRTTIYYPDTCKKYNIQGRVFVKVLVDKEGRVRKHVVKKSPHPLLTKEIESKIYALRFSPALKENNQPTKYWVSMPFNFTLK